MTQFNSSQPDWLADLERLGRVPTGARPPSPGVDMTGVLTTPASRELAVEMGLLDAEPPTLTVEESSEASRRLLEASINELALNDELFRDAPTDVSKLRRLNQIRRRFDDPDLPPLDELPDALKPVGPIEELGKQFTTPRALAEKVPFAGEIATTAVDLATILPAANRVREGKETEEDLEVLADAAERAVEAQRPRTMLGTAARVASQIPTYGVEFFATGGAGTIARKAAVKTAAKVAGKAIADVVEKTLKRRGIKGLTDVAAQVAAFEAIKIVPQAAKRTMPEIRDLGKQELVVFEGEQTLTALKNAGFDIAVEITSERAGVPIAAIGRFGGGLLGKAIRKVLPSTKGLGKKVPKLSLTARSFLNRVGYQGPITEELEELGGRFVRQAATDAGFVELPQEELTVDQIIGEMLAFTLPVAGGFAADVRSRRREGLQPEGVEEVGPVAETEKLRKEEEITTKAKAMQRKGLSAKAARARAEKEVSPEVKAPPVEQVQAEPELEAPPREPTEAVTETPSPKEDGESTTSIKNAVVDQERKKRGLRPAMESARRSFGMVWDDAMRIIEESPKRQDALIAELAAEPRPIFDTEDALLLHRQISLQNEHDKVSVQLERALESGDPVAIAQLESQEEVLLAELLQLYDINKAVGRATARGLNARKMLAAEDFSLVRMIAIKRKAIKGKLSQADIAAVKVAHDKIIELETKMREFTERIDELEADRASVQATKDIVSSQVKPSAGKRVAKAKLEQAWKDFEGEISGKLFVNPLDPQLIGSMVKLAKAHIEFGIATLNDFLVAVKKKLGSKADGLTAAMTEAWNQAMAESVPLAPETLNVPSPRRPAQMSMFARKLAKFFVSTGTVERDALIDRVHAELIKIVPMMTRRQAMDAISGYGQFSLLSKGEIDVRLRDLKGQMQQIGKLEDMQVGKAPLKTGMERREPSDEERHLIQQVNEMKRRGGFDVTDPAIQLKSALGAIKTRLRNQIVDLEQQIYTGERIVRERTDAPVDKEIQRLMKQRDALKKQFDEIFGRRELTDEQRTRVAIRAAKRSIAELERRIKERDLGPKRQISKVRVTAELQSVREQRDALKAELKELQEIENPRKTPEERALAALKTRLRNRIADYQDRLAREDFASRVRKETALDKEGEKLRFAVEQAKAEFLRAMIADVRKNRTLTEKIFGTVPELTNTLRAILVSFDLSAVGRQGAIVNFAHPLRGASKIGVMLRSFKSKAVASAAVNKIQNRPNAALYKRARLEFTDPEGGLSQQEEIYMARWSKFIPGVAGSERAFVTYLNELRADTFDAMVATLGKSGTATEAEAKVIANYVNVAVGRGNLGQIRQAAVFLATVFFAPRYLLSRFQYLTFQPLRFKGNTARTRSLIAQEYARTIIGMGVFFSTTAFALYALVGPPGDDEEWNIELDLRSSDFGKIRIGKTRIDPLFGISQVIVFTTRMFLGETKSIKRRTIEALRGEKVPFGMGAIVVGTRFLRSKLSPIFGSIVDVFSGKDFKGRDVTVKAVAKNLTIPIAWKDIELKMREHGVPGGTAVHLLELVGMSTVTFEDNLGGTTGPDRDRRKALNEIYALRGRFLAGLGRETGVFPRSDFADIRESLMSDDYEAYKEAMLVFARRKTNQGQAWGKSYFLSVGRLDPIAATLNRELEEKFEQEFLNPTQRKRLLVARKYAQDLAILAKLWFRKFRKELRKTLRE